jgi:hypothetical protein
MVVIKQYSTSQIDQLNNVTGRVLYDTNLNILRFNDASSYNNILVHKDSTNNVTGINNLLTTGNLGINTSSPTKQVEINSSTGECLRLTYNDNDGSATNYTDLYISSSGNLSITPSGGATTLSSTLAVTGATTLSNTTDATSSTAGGAFTLSGGAAIAKKLFVGTDLSVGGNTIFTGTVAMNGSFQLNSTIDASSSSTGALIILGGVGIAKKLYIGTDLNVGANSSLSGTLGVTGASTLSSTLAVSGATTLSNTLAVTGASTLSSTLEVSGATTLSNTLAVTGATTLSSTLGITGATTLSSTLGVTGATTLSSTLGVTGATTLSSTLAVTGASTLSSTLAVTGATTLSNTTDATSSTSGGAFTLSGGAAIAKKLYVGTDLSVGGNATFTGPILAIPTGNTSSRPSVPQVGYIRYNSQTSQFEGYGAGNAWGSLGGVSDVNQNTRILAEDGAGTDDDNLRFFNDGVESMRLTAVGLMGLGTSAPDKKLEINSATGDCLRLTYNDNDGSATNYVDLLVTSGGNLTITPSGGDINISSHNGSTTGLKLNNVLVTSTATELNYVDTTPGTAAASKALVLDSNRDIININYLESNQAVLIKENSGNNIVDYPLSLISTPNTTAANGLGVGIEFNSVNDNNDIYNAGYINYISTDVTNNSESGYFDFKLANNGSIDSIMTLANNGVITCTSMVETSDIRVKENIQDTLSSNSLDKILQVNVKTYNFKKDINKRNHTGVIAQELKEILPEAVLIAQKDELEDFHSVHYTQLIPHLINCVKELYKELKELQKNKE